jgi:oxygen-dependent protoporphyrinogen oxidase
LRVVVVGGGLAGLFTASELLAQEIEEVTVLEGAPHPGGVSRTIERDGFQLEPAAGSFNLPHPHLSPILDRAGVETEQTVGASTRHVFVDGRLVSLSPSPRAILAPVLSIGSKLRVLAEPLVSAASPARESLGAFCRRRFGEAAGDLAASLMAAGVYAGDPEELSVSAAFPALAELEEEHGSVVLGALRRRRSAPKGPARPVMHVPREGMSGLAATLAESLGEHFRASFPVDSVERRRDEWVLNGPEQLVADVVVLAIPPWRAAELFEGEASVILGRSTAAEVAVVGIGGRGPSPLPAGFGALVGPGDGMCSVGVLFESSYAPSRVPEGAWLAKVIVGGARRPEVAGMSDDRVAGAVTRELGCIVDVDLSPEFVEVVRHRPGIPQYSSGHRAWLRQLGDTFPPSMHLAGWGYRGVGVARLATDARRLADVIRRRGASA